MLRCAETPQSWSQQAKYPLFNAQTVQVCLGHLLRHSTQELAVKATFCFPSLHRGQGSTHESSFTSISHFFSFLFFASWEICKDRPHFGSTFQNFAAEDIYICLCVCVRKYLSLSNIYIYMYLTQLAIWLFMQKKMTNIFLTCRINHLKASFICYFFMIT